MLFLVLQIEQIPRRRFGWTVGPVKCQIYRVSEHLPRPSFSLDSLCALFLYVNKVWEITISNMKCHDALIYPYKVLLCNSFFFPILQGSIPILIWIVLSFFPCRPTCLQTQVPFLSGGFLSVFNPSFLFVSTKGFGF